MCVYICMYMYVYIYIYILFFFSSVYINLNSYSPLFVNAVIMYMAEHNDDLPSGRYYCSKFISYIKFTFIFILSCILVYDVVILSSVVMYNIIICIGLSFYDVNASDVKYLHVSVAYKVCFCLNSNG